MSNAIIFQPSDLVQRRVEVLDAARAGRAQIRDKDGTSLVMLPESRLRLLEEVVEWTKAHLRLETLLGRGGAPSVSDLGDLAWLRVFDVDDLREFAEELQDSLVAALADQDAAVLDECVHAWRVTARQLEDPLRRSVLLGRVAATDLEEAPYPREP